MHIAYLMRRYRLLWVLFFSVSTLLSTVNYAEAQDVPRPTRKGRKYKVRIDSAPQQAAIYLDDEKYGIVGYTPWSGRLQKGDWKVIIKKDGYETATRIVQIKRTRRTQETFIPLVKKDEPAIIEVRADADKNAFNGEVWVDGQLQGKLPIVLKLDDGRHLVEIKKEGFETFSQWVTSKEGERVTVNPMLREIKKEEFGSILVNADVNDAEVLLDGNLQDDKTPTLIAKIPVGPHVVEVRKEPAMPWRQTIEVVADQTVKVNAELKATMGGDGGNIRVLSNVEGAMVYLDGQERGPVPQDLKNVPIGDHVVEVKAAGFLPREQRVTVAVGAATILKLDLQPDGANAVGVVKIVSPVPEAEVFIDGERIGGVPQEKELPTGEHFVVVSKPGFKRFERKLVVEDGKTITVTAELKSVGGIRFLSNPSGAEVMLDGHPIGTTPFVNEEIDSGDHVVSINMPGFFAFETPVTVEGGKLKVVNAVLEKIDDGPTAEELQREQRGLTSYGARTLPTGRSTVDFSTGYPYYVHGGITVGGPDLGSMGFDVGVDVRGYFTRTELLFRSRLNFYDKEPFSFGAMAQIGAGGTIFDDSQRNSFFGNLGAQASLTGLGAVTVTGRFYLNMWTDRHCPALDGNEFEKGTDPVGTCEDYNDGSINAEDKERLDGILGGAGEIFERDNGIRPMASIIFELALQQHWNAFLLFETSLSRTERAAFINDFHGAMLSEDFRSYVQIGGTYKF